MPSGSNNVKYNTWFYGRTVGGPGYAWCCVFVVWCFHQAGLDALWLNGKIKETAYCPYVESTAKKLGRWVSGDFLPGDCLLFDWEDDNHADHIGFVERVNTDGSLTTIEGNTSFGNIGSQSNGGCVARRTRQLRDIRGAFRPNFEEDDTMTQDQFNEMLNNYRKTLQDNDAGAWSEADRLWAQQIGLFVGDGTGNFMWMDFTTKEQIAAVAHRLYEAMTADGLH
jgi:hypothetical protein